MSGTKENQLLAMQQKMEQLIRENEELKKRQYVPPVIACTVTDRGAVSVTGLGKYPVQLFAEQFQRLLSKKEMILQFIEDNQNDLSWRNNKS
jgi:hypothetical protein